MNKEILKPRSKLRRLLFFWESDTKRINKNKK